MKWCMAMPEAVMRAAVATATARSRRCGYMAEKVRVWSDPIDGPPMHHKRSMPMVSRKAAMKRTWSRNVMAGKVGP